MASSTPGAGFAFSTPSKRIERTSTSVRSRTMYSWNAISPSGPAIIVRTGSFAMGKTVQVSPHAAASPPTTSCMGLPSRIWRVRWMAIARSRSPRLNHRSYPNFCS